MVDSMAALKADETVGLMVVKMAEMKAVLMAVLMAARMVVRMVVRTVAMLAH